MSTETSIPVGEKRRGRGEWVQPEGDSNLWTAHINWIARWSELAQHIPQKGVTAHPDYPNLKADRIRATRNEDLVTISVTYAGPNLEQGEPGPEDLPDPEEEVDTGTYMAPIETHPRFLTDDMAGENPSNPQNGALFDPETQEFIGWAAGSDFRGMSHYYAPTLTYRVIRYSLSKPTTVAGVGLVRVPPSYPSAGIAPPDVGPFRNFLFKSRTWRRRGGIYQINEEDLMSNQGGWNPIVYGAPE